MSDVSRDWLEAEWRIEEARVSGAEVLDLSELDIEAVPGAVVELELVRSIIFKSCHYLRDLAISVPMQWLDFGWSDIHNNWSALAQLKALRHLDFTDCKTLSNLLPLASLSALQSLSLGGCETLNDLSPLVSLTVLRQLSINDCKSLKNLSPLTSLTTLQQLSLSGCDALGDLLPLASLTALQQLDLSWCAAVTDLSPLASLTILQQLDLSGCKALNDLSPLILLTALRQLDLSNCQELSNLSSLISLTNLQQLDLSWCQALSNLLPLASLTALQRLNLRGCELLSSLSPLASLISLQYLDLSRCKALNNLLPLLKLHSLVELKLINSISLSLLPEKSVLDTAADLKAIYCDKLLIAPNELASQADTDNCLPRLKAWRADLDQGQADNHRIKLFVLGNGSAGKTQICRRLNGQAFDPSISSTHGIELDLVTLIPANEDKPAAIAHVWDFGGQDIYHGTHALFMDERALFVIVWNPELEAAQPYTEHGVAMRHRPLAYWLAMVRDVAGEDAAVVVVQSKCDRQQDSVQPPLPTEHGLRYLRYTACSAKNQSGMSSLLTSIQDQAQLLLERYGQVLLPVSWVAVGDTLRARCSEGLRTLPRAEFETLCRTHHASAPPEVVLRYLHGSGEVFYRPGLFGDQLILNQQWALKGVYAVLDRQCSLPLLRRLEGKFDQEILDELVWRGEYSSNEQALFISLMEQCGACFPVNQDWDHPKKTHYLAPDLLPERSEAQEKIDDKWRRVEAHLEVWLNYRFLHDGVMKALLCAIGRRAGVHAVYWRYGVCFFDQGMQATFLLEAQPDIDPQRPGAGRLVWQAHVVQENKMAEVQRWLEDLLSTAERNTQGQRPEVSWQRSQAHTPAQDRKASDNEDPIQRLQPGSQPDAKPTVYVSYGWGEANTALLAQLKAAFIQRGCQLIYDKEKKRPGDWISTFMREIGSSRHVLLLLDEKYMQSIYCMRELHYLHSSAMHEKSNFLQRIVPCVLAELELGNGLQRSKYIEFWRKKKREYKKLIKKQKYATGDPTMHEGRAINAFYQDTDQLLGWISDVMMPRGAHALSADNFAAIFTALQNQGFPLPAATGPGQ